MIAINKLNTTVQSKIASLQMALVAQEEGIFPRLRDLEAGSDDLDDKLTKIAELEEKNLMLVEDNQQLKGIVQVQDRKIATLQKQVINLRARSMANNVVISGIIGDDEDED